MDIARIYNPFSLDKNQINRNNTNNNIYPANDFGKWNQDEYGQIYNRVKTYDNNYGIKERKIKYYSEDKVLHEEKKKNNLQLNNYRFNNSNNHQANINYEKPKINEYNKENY